MPNLIMARNQRKFALHISTFFALLIAVAFYYSSSAKATSKTSEPRQGAIDDKDDAGRASLLEHPQLDKDEPNRDRSPRRAGPQVSIYDPRLNNRDESRDLVLVHGPQAEGYNDEQTQHIGYTSPLQHPTDDQAPLDGVANLPNHGIESGNSNPHYHQHHEPDNSQAYDHTQLHRFPDNDVGPDGSSSSSPSLSDIPFDANEQFSYSNNNQFHGQDRTNGLAEPSLPDEKIYISRELVREVCQLDRGSQRSEPLNSTYLNHCKRYKLENLLSNEILMSIMHQDAEICEKLLDEFIQLDELINQFDTMFRKLLTRYNCHNGYSVKWSCEDCKKAYKDWLCATNLPFYMNGERIKPCISFCERVEQRCPYLHPITKEQYGGQPVFICRDPNIPFIPEITPDIPFSDPGKCYELCHLSDNLTELVIDSLSKYEHERCPDKSSIAEGVRTDPYYSGPNGSGGPRPDFNRKLQHDPDAHETTISKHQTSSTSSPSDAGFDENYDQFNEPDIALTHSVANETSPKVLVNGDHQPSYPIRPKKPSHAHNKKLDELREVLTNYKNQPKSHKFGHHIEHASLDYHTSTKQFIASSNSF